MGVYSDLAQTLLDIAVAAVTDPPDEQRIVVGEPALDCEMVVVSHLSTVRRETAGPTGVRRDQCFVLPVTTWRVAVVRCWPTGEEDANPVPAAEINAVSAQMLDDGEDLFNALFDNQDQFPGTARLGPAIPIQPAGWLAGYAVDVEIDLMETASVGS